MENNIEFPYVFKLDHPLTVGEKKIERITLKHRPRAKDLKSMDEKKGDIAKMIALVANLSDELPVYIEQMDGRDFLRLSEVVGSFLS